MYRRRNYRRGRPTAYDRQQDRRIRQNTQSIETKFVDATFALDRTQALVTWDIDRQLDINQGDTVSTRDGNATNALSFYMRGIITPNGTSTELVGVSIRIVVMIQTITTTTAPLAADIFSVDNINGMHDLTNLGTGAVPHTAKAFKFIFDKTFNMNVERQTQHINFFHTFPGGMIQQWTADAATRAHTNAIYILMSKTASVDGWGFDGQCRLRFQG